MSNKHLQKAKDKKDDEYYTQYIDIKIFIETVVLRQNPTFFNNKVVVNFASGVDSNFGKYFTNNFESLGLKGIIRTQFSPEADFTVAEVKTRKTYTAMEGKGNGSIGEQDYLDNINKLKQKGLNLIFIDNPPFSNSRATKKFLHEVGDFISIQATTWRTGYGPFKVDETACFHGPTEYFRPNGQIEKVKTNWWTTCGLKPIKPLPTGTEGDWKGKKVRFVDNIVAIREEKGVLWGVPITWTLYNSPGGKTHESIRPVINGRSTFDRIIIEWEGGE